MKMFFLVFAAISVFTLSASAQKNDIGITAGGYFPLKTQYHINTSFAIGGAFAHRIASVPLLSLYIEVPVYGTFNSTADITGSTLTRPKYSALFVTPGLKLKFAPSFPITPYVVFGGGLAHFSKSNVTTGDSTNTGTFDVGGGLDFKIAPYVGIRTEVRDYYSGSPNLTVNFTDRQHQLIATAGLVFRF